MPKLNKIHLHAFEMFAMEDHIMADSYQLNPDGTVQVEMHGVWTAPELMVLARCLDDAARCLTKERIKLAVDDIITRARGIFDDTLAACPDEGEAYALKEANDYLAQMVGWTATGKYAA